MYSYPFEENVVTMPLHEEEINRDMSNFLNHSCDPNVWIESDYSWSLRRDVEAGEYLTMDYATFDVNCDLGQCQCETLACRKFVFRNDYRNVEVRNKYWGHFQGFIHRRIMKEFPDWVPPQYVN